MSGKLRMSMLCPSGAHLALAEDSAPMSTSSRTSPSSTSSVYTLPRVLKRIRVPSGDQSGNEIGSPEVYVTGSLPSGLTMHSGAMNGHPNAILEPSGDHVGFDARAGDARSTTRRVVPSATRTAQRPVAHGYAISVPLGDQAYAGLVTGAPALAGRTSRSPVPSGRATRITHGSGPVLYASHLPSADQVIPTLPGIGIFVLPEPSGLISVPPLRTIFPAAPGNACGDAEPEAATTVLARASARRLVAMPRDRLIQAERAPRRSRSAKGFPPYRRARLVSRARAFQRRLSSRRTRVLLRASIALSS